jgi:hypothetical protein
MDLVNIEELIPASIEFSLGGLGSFLSRNAGKIALVGGLALGGYALYKYGQLKGKEQVQREQQAGGGQQQALGGGQPQPGETTQTTTGQTTLSTQQTSQTPPAPQQPFRFNWITITIGLVLVLALGVILWMFLRPKK